MRAPTIRDVARLAEVAIDTASKALNKNGRLSQETRDRVMRIAREIGYRPNDLAQSLHRSKSMTIGIISNDSFGRLSFPIFEALEEVSPSNALPSSYATPLTIPCANDSTLISFLVNALMAWW